MPARLIYGPVVTETLPDGSVARWPKVAALADSGAVGRRYGQLSAISDGQPGSVNDWCLSLVVGSNLAAVDADAELVNILEEAGGTVAGIRAMLVQSPNELGWSAAKRNRVQNRLTAKGADLSGLNANSPLWQFLNRLAQVVMPGCDIRKWDTTFRGYNAA
jgi:hypothetical protein